MKWSVVGLVVVGLVAALCAAVLAAAVRAGGLQALTSKDAGPTELEITVALRDLPPMTVVDADSVTTEKVSGKEAPEGYYSSPVQVIGKLLSLPLKKGQPFTNSCFASGRKQKLAVAVQKGMRAVSISLDDYSGLYGVLYPGGMVDVLATFKQRAERGQPSDVVSLTLLRAIQVLGVEGQTVVTQEPAEKKESKVAEGARQRSKRVIVTLMVTPGQAQLLQLGMEHGTLSLAMRNPLDTGDSITRPPLPMSKLLKNPLSELSGTFAKFLPRPSRRPAPPDTPGDVAKVEPGTDEPGTDEPGTDEPGTDEPGTDEPGTGEIGTGLPEGTPPGLLAEFQPPPRKWTMIVLRGDKETKEVFTLPNEYDAANSAQTE